MLVIQYSFVRKEEVFNQPKLTFHAQIAVSAFIKSNLGLNFSHPLMLPAMNYPEHRKPIDFLYDFSNDLSISNQATEDIRFDDPLLSTKRELVWVGLIDGKYHGITKVDIGDQFAWGLNCDGYFPYILDIHMVISENKELLITISTDPDLTKNAIAVLLEFVLVAIASKRFTGGQVNIQGGPTVTMLLIQAFYDFGIGVFCTPLQVEHKKPMRLTKRAGTSPFDYITEELEFSVFRRVAAKELNDSDLNITIVRFVQLADKYYHIRRYDTDGLIRYDLVREEFEYCIMETFCKEDQMNITDLSYSDNEHGRLLNYLLDFLLVEATRSKAKSIDVNIEVEPQHKLFLDKILLDFGFCVEVASASLKAQMAL
ncbi:hypothetical protein PV783_14095 [Chitinophaga sp. CC14]